MSWRQRKAGIRFRCGMTEKDLAFVDALTQGAFEAVPATVKATLAVTGSLDGSGQDTLAGFMPTLLELCRPAIPCRLRSAASRS
jgi:hypothetical protein